MLASTPLHIREIQLMIPPNVTYKIYDKTFKNSTYIYAENRFTAIEKIHEVKRNKHAVLADLYAKNLLILNQVHGSTVVDADRITDFQHEPEADAAVTSIPGVAIGILTADCVPILLASQDGTVIGGAHCGWRSAKADILANTVQLMQEKGATSITAIIGPAICQESYEVDQVFYDEIISSESDAAHFFVPAQNRYMFDLPAFVLYKLEKCGITDVVNLCENTYTNPEKYFSYRRDVQTGYTGYRSNILSAIVIK